MEDGEIVGRTTPETNRTTYLHRDGVFDDFELEFEIMLEGDTANSGMQYRSRRLGPEVGDGWDLEGYQADFDARHNYTGILYETRGRAIAALRGESKRFMVDGSTRDLAAPRTDDELGVTLGDGWHRYRIVADGERLEHWINGVRVLLVEDAAPTRTASGSLALQVHAGDPMAVRMRNIRIRAIGEGSLDLDVGQAGAPAEPQWIWAAEETRDGEQCTFIRSFSTEQAAKITVVATCDNVFKLLLDGAEGPRGRRLGADPRLARHDRTGRAPGPRPLHQRERAAGFVAMIVMNFEDGSTRRILTDGEWLTESTDTRRLLRPMPVHSFGTILDHSGPWGNVMQSKQAEGTRTWSLPEDSTPRSWSRPSPDRGSWVSCDFDPRGRLVVCPQYGSLQVIVFDDDGAVTSVRPLPDVSGEPLGHAQGLLHAHDALWVNVSRGPDDGGGCGDCATPTATTSTTNGPGGEYGNGSEHGCHGVALAPDGSLWVVNGNYTKPPRDLADDSPFRGWAEDQLLEREWDPNGHAVGVSMPAGTVQRYDPATGEWTMLVGGFRNAYDLAFSPGGECFLYDSDMEWDIGTPWHIWPLVHHVVPGADYGWRAGNGKVPLWAPDRMRTVCETDESSPTGVAFGDRSSYPEPWRSRFFIGDWSYGRVLAVDLVPEGSTYTGTSTSSRGARRSTSPTSRSVRREHVPAHRRSYPSGLYRISSDSSVPVGPDRLPRSKANAELRAARHAIQSDARPTPQSRSPPSIRPTPAPTHRSQRGARRGGPGLSRRGVRPRRSGCRRGASRGRAGGRGPRRDRGLLAGCLRPWRRCAAPGPDARPRDRDRRGGEPSGDAERCLDALDPLLPMDDFEFDRQLVELLVASRRPTCPFVSSISSSATRNPRTSWRTRCRSGTTRTWDADTVEGMMSWTSNASELHGGTASAGS